MRSNFVYRTMLGWSLLLCASLGEDREDNFPIRLHVSASAHSSNTNKLQLCVACSLVQLHVSLFPYRLSAAGLCEQHQLVVKCLLSTPLIRTILSHSSLYCNCGVLLTSSLPVPSLKSSGLHTARTWPRPILTPRYCWL